MRGAVSVHRRLPGPEPGNQAVVLGILPVHHGLFRPAALGLEQSLRAHAAGPARRPGSQSPAPEPRHDHPPAFTFPGLRRFRHPRLSGPGPGHAPKRKRGLLAARGPALYPDGLAVPDRGNRARRLVGLYGTGLGRLLGLGPCGKRLDYPLAAGHGRPAYRSARNPARQTASRQHLSYGADHGVGLFRHLPGARRRGQFGALLRRGRRRPRSACICAGGAGSGRCGAPTAARRWPGWKPAKVL